MQHVQDLLKARTAPNHLDMGRNSHMEYPSSNLVQISLESLMQFLDLHSSCGARLQWYVCNPDRRKDVPKICAWWDLSIRDSTASLYCTSALERLHIRRESESAWHAGQVGYYSTVLYFRPPSNPSVVVMQRNHHPQ